MKNDLPSFFITPKQTINKYNFKPYKGKGQNFLIDPDSLYKIVEFSQFSADDIVLEIGAGIGNLTILILQKVKKLYAVEKDKRLVNIISNELQDFKNLRIINDDILKLNLSNFVKDKGEAIKVIGNLPYNISTPVLFNLMEERKFFSCAILMFQKEFGQRIIASCGSKDYGILAVFCQTFFNIKKGHVISPKCFFPVPKVESIVVKLIPKKDIKINNNMEKEFKILVRSAFGNRRKTLKNALIASSLPIKKDDIVNGIKKACISLDRRPETLSTDEFCHLTKILFST